MKYEDPCDPEPASLLDRERRLRLFQQLHQSPEGEVFDEYFWWRASGHMRCAHCGLLYREHPLDWEDSNGLDGDPVDHRLCSGDVVHL